MFDKIGKKEITKKTRNHFTEIISSVFQIGDCAHLLSTRSCTALDYIDCINVSFHVEIIYTVVCIFLVHVNVVINIDFGNF